MKFAFVMTAAVCVLTSTMAQAKDPNLTQEGDKVTVKRSACVGGDGLVSDSDYRYFTCDGGKYDGYITAGPASNCNDKIAQSESLLDVDGTPHDESEFSKVAAEALAACTVKAQDRSWADVEKVLLLAKKACNSSADGMSQLYLATCQLNAAKLGAYIMK